jgi:hypothetical protein
MQVQKHLQMRVEAQGKYMQSILEKAYQALGSSECTTWPTGYIGGNSSMGFSSLQDLHFYGGSSSYMDQHQLMDHNFLTLGETAGGSSSVSKKGMPAASSNHCSSTSNSSMMWAGEEQQAKSATGQLQMGSSSTSVMDPTITNMYDGAKPIMSGDHSMGSNEGFEGLNSKLEMMSFPPSQEATPVRNERISSPTMVGGQARNLSYKESI